MANKAGDAYVDVHPELQGFGKKLMGGIDPGLDDAAHRTTSKLGGAFKAVAGIAGGVFVGSKLFELGGDLLKLGTEIDVFGKKAKTVFEDSTGDVTAWAKSNASSFGLTDDKLRGLAANFGDLLKPMGFTSKEAADMSTKVVGLSGALSAWSGGTRSAAEVSEILASAMLGERDALKGLGIAISEADVQARLAEKGQQDLTGAALQQAQALATQELIFEKSADAQKAWADGSMDAVKKQNSLKEKVAELREWLASKLQPAFAAVTAFAVDRVLPALEKLGGGVQGLFDLFFKRDFSGALSKAFGWEEDSAIVDKLFKVRDALAAVFGFIQDNVVPIGAALAAVIVAAMIPAVTGLAASVAALFSPVTLVVAGIALLVAGVVYAYTHFEGFRKVVDKVVDFLVGTVLPRIVDFVGFIVQQFANLVGWVRTHWDDISEAISHVVNVVKAYIEGWVAAVTFLWRTFGDEILSVARIVWDQILNVVSTVVGIVRGIIETGLALINGDWGKAWDGIKGILSTAKDFIVETGANAMRLLREGIEGAISGLVAFMGGIPGRMLDALGNLGSLLYNAGIEIIQGLWNGLKDRAADMLGWVGGLAGKIARLKGPLDRDKKLLIPAGEAIMQGLIRGLRAEEGRLVEQLARTTGLVSGVGGGGLSPAQRIPLVPGNASGGSSDAQPMDVTINVGPGTPPAHIVAELDWLWQGRR